MKNVIGFILVAGCLVVCVWQLVGVFKDIWERRKRKKEKPQDPEEKDDEE